MPEQKEAVSRRPPVRTSRPRLEDPAAVAAALCSYLEPLAGAGPLCFAEGPTEVPDGWETYIYRFRLQSASPLPPRLARPLVLRAYASPQGVPRACHEFNVQRHVHRLGYPAPEPLLVEEDSAPLGGPFLLLDVVPGETLLDRLRRRFRDFLKLPALLARLHLRLHALPAHEFQAPPQPLLERSLDRLGDAIHEYSLDDLRVGLDWLRARRPPGPETLSILHLDFHPNNVMVLPDRQPSGVLDWCEADVGDRHADVATTLLLLHAAPAEVRTLGERLLARPARWSMVRHYWDVYTRGCRLDRGRVRYYLAWAALRRMAMYGMWLRAGPESTGSKPAVLQHLTPEHVEALRRGVRRWTGVEVRLPPLTLKP